MMRVEGYCWAAEGVFPNVRLRSSVVDGFSLDEIKTFLVEEERLSGKARRRDNIKEEHCAMIL